MIGLVYCLLLSERYGELDRNFTTAFLQFAVKNGYPFEAVKEYSFEQLIEYLMKDKKRSMVFYNLCCWRKLVNHLCNQLI